jgi:prepilin-type N-terminal cleavage/methylation domain-containing protein
MNKSRQRALTALCSAHNARQGLTLIEVLIALGILAAVAVVFLASMSTSSRAVIIHQEQVNAEGLAKSQMEAIKLWAYDDTNPPNYEAAKLANIPADYNIAIDAVRLEANPDNDPSEDDGLQKIKVTVTHKGKTVFWLEGYKCRIGQ